MYTVTGGYYYQGTVKSTKSLHTNRNRVKRIILLLVLFTGSFLSGALMNAYASESDATAVAEQQYTPVVSAYTSYSVEPGDTLWAIAKLHAPASIDIREFIHDIKAMNHLESSNLHVGQLLQIPNGN